MNKFFDRHATPLLALCLFTIGSAPSFGSDREPTAHSYDFVRSVCDGALYECGMGEMNGQQCLIAYCISGDHKNNPKPWYYSCPEKST